MSNVKPKREWNIAVGAILRTSWTCIAVVREGTAHHSLDGRPHNCWIGIDYSTGKVYEVFIARVVGSMRAPVYGLGDLRMVHPVDGRTSSTVVAIERGNKNWLVNCYSVLEITLPM